MLRAEEASRNKDVRAALEELVARGGDWDSRRLGAKSNRLVSLRCERGHDVGTIYETSLGYLLVARRDHVTVTWGPNREEQRGRRDRWTADDGFPPSMLLNRDGMVAAEGWLASQRVLHCSKCPESELPNDESLISLAAEAREKGRTVTYRLARSH